MLLKKLAKYLLSKLPIRVRCLVQSIRSTGKISISSGSFIDPSVHLLGKANMHLGSNSCISEGSWLNVNHRIKNNISIDIGNNCFIGKHNFFSSGKSILIGDYTLTTIGCKFIGSSHQINNPDIPYLLTGTTNVDSIKIGVNCFLGAETMVLGNVKIGHGSIIGAGSLVLHDIPPFSIAIGNPAKVQKRYSYRHKKWLPLTEITEEDEMAMPNEQDYLSQLQLKFPHVNIPWIAASKKMGDL
jgi:acetyltransferase-like isoleucine patch superfamily enzyme